MIFSFQSSKNTLTGRQWPRPERRGDFPEQQTEETGTETAPALKFKGHVLRE